MAYAKAWVGVSLAATWAVGPAAACGAESQPVLDPPAACANCEPLLKSPCEPAAKPPCACEPAARPNCGCESAARPNCGCEPASPFAGDLHERPYLLGDLGGLRSDLLESGISLDFSTTQFYQGVTSGGIDRRFAYGGRNDYLIKMDGEKLGLNEGLFIDLHGETRFGEAVNGEVAALSPPNTALLFPVPGRNISALSGVMFTQFLSEDFAVYTGKINTLDGYLHPFAAGGGSKQFMNLSLNFPPILARLVPYSSLGAGFLVLEDKQPIFSLLAIDPTGQPTQSGFDDVFGEGITLYGQAIKPVELGDLPGHHVLAAAWGNRTVTSLDQTSFLNSLPDPVGPPEQKSSSWAVHYSGDQMLWIDPCNSARRWGVFGQASISDGNPNPIRWYASAGFGGTGLYATRPADSWGIAAYRMQLGSAVKQTLPGANLGNETGFEAYYNIAVTPWFHLTPDVQVLDGFRKNFDNSVVAGLRGRIEW